MEYVRIAEGLGGKYKLVPSDDEIWNYVETNDKDYYVSLYKYNDEHYKFWKENNTVSGIKNVKTSKILFDFDSKTDLEKARQDAVTLVSRLLAKGISSDVIAVAFSGSKGFSIEVDTNKSFTPEEFKNVTFALANDLQTFDTVVNDANRIIRLVGTKHNKSGLYKLPLTVEQLSELPINDIKELASSVENVDQDIINKWQTVELPESIYQLRLSPKKEEKKIEIVTTDLDMRLKPKWLSEAKYALQEGYFLSGERNSAFMILASTYKNQGFNKEIVYRMLKGVAEAQSQRNNQERYADKELYNNVVEVVFSEHWKGGTYSYDNTPLLQEVTKRLGLTIPKEENILVPVENVTDIFKKFATDIDSNTIKLGIPTIDDQVRITTSMLVGLLAAPSAGKTSVSLNILNDASRSGTNAIFFSLDMGAPLVYQRLFQKHTGLSSKKIFEMYKANDGRLKELEQRVIDQYKNVKFCFKSGLTTDAIREYILKQQETTGEKVRLVVIDYLECLSGPYSDATANTALISQQLKDIANELELCILLLLQPQKHAGDPSCELLSYRNIKGSSAIEQAASVIFTMWRPGFSPKEPENDKYMTIAAVKNRMGNLATFNFSWDGLTGELQELDDFELGELDELRKRKAAEKAEADL